MLLVQNPDTKANTAHGLLSIGLVPSALFQGRVREVFAEDKQFLQRKTS